MKFARYGEPGRERPAMVDSDGRLRELPYGIRDIDPLLLTDETSLAMLRSLRLSDLPLVDSDVRISCPIAGISKIVGIGLNYHDHARECGAAIPSEPIVFFKSVTSLSGPSDPIVLPLGAEKTDWEVELGVVIGRLARGVAAVDGLAHVFGYCVAHDVSDRGHQLERGGQWTKGKSHDTFCPVGPWLVTADEIADPQALDLWCAVDGVKRQASSTSEMIFGVAHVVSYVSQFMTLLPGDLLITGTPAGVGLGQKPQVYLRRGSTVRLGVAGLGTQQQLVV